MSMGKKIYSKQEKLKILKEASEKGLKVTLEKYNLYPATFYYWKQKYFISGESGLTHGNSKEVSGRVKELEKELKQYKEILAEKELIIRLKDELLKKRYPQAKK
ncbi:MAG: transposase [Cellulosilyticaceae bacterium]